MKENVDLNKALKTMVSAALESGRLLMSLQKAVKRVESRKDFLTDADLKSEEIILSVLNAEYAEISSFSEESGAKKTSSGYIWVIDPLDGTLNYFFQDDHWGVSIALVKNGKTVAAVIFEPAKEFLFTATNRQKSKIIYIKIHKKPKTLEVNKETDIHSAQFWFGWGKELHGCRDHIKLLNLLQKVDKVSLYPQIRNCATADIMTVALGRIGGYVFPNPEPFDVAAAGLIIERAGGVVTQINGKPWSAFSNSFIASNGFLHNKLLKTLK